MIRLYESICEAQKHLWLVSKYVETTATQNLKPFPENLVYCSTLLVH